MVGLRLVGVLICVLYSVSFAFAQSDDRKHKKSNFGFGIEAKLFGADATFNESTKVSDIPLNLRQVPSHPEDTWIYGSRRVIRTIPSDTIIFNGSNVGQNFAFSPELTVWRLRARSGVNFFVGGSGDGPSKDSDNTTREMNQYGGSSRGYGTSLVYYSVYSKSSRKPGINNEVDFDIGNDLLLIAGYSWRNYNLVAQSGYDRWDSLEEYSTSVVSENKFVKRYAGFGWQPDLSDDNTNNRPLTISAVVGKGKTTANLTGAGTGMKVEYGRPWFFEFSFAAHGVFWRK